MLSRRRFLSRSTSAMMGLVGALLSVPAIGFVLSPLFTKRTLSGWVTVGRVDNIPVNSPVKFVVGLPLEEGPDTTTPVARVVYAVRRPDNAILALANICTHMQCDVHWDATMGYPGNSNDGPLYKGMFVCPCHGGLYTVDGQNVFGPPPQPLAQWVNRTITDASGHTILQVRNQLTEHI